MYSAHMLFDAKIPNRQSDYSREIDEMAVEFAPDKNA